MTDEILTRRNTHAPRGLQELAGKLQAVKDEAARGAEARAASLRKRASALASGAQERLAVAEGRISKYKARLSKIPDLDKLMKELMP